MKKAIKFSLVTLFVFALIIRSQDPKEVETHATLGLEESYSKAYLDISDRIKNSYVEERDIQDILKNGLYGLTKGLDPYTRILTGSKKKYYERLSKGSYGGVGIHLSNIKDISPFL